MDLSRDEQSTAAAQARRRPGVLRLSPQASLILALLVLGLSTYAAVTQSPHPDAHRESSMLSGEWWRYPFEWNPPGRLPVVSRDLKDVYAVPGTETIYAVGELGAVLVTDDGGRTWQTPASRTPSPAPTQIPAPSPTATATPTSQDDQSTVSRDASERVIEIMVTDGRADVYRGTEKVGATPYSVRGKLGDRVRLTLRREGYDDEPVDFVVGEKKSFMYTLARAAPTPNATPSRLPPGTGPDPVMERQFRDLINTGSASANSNAAATSSTPLPQPAAPPTPAPSGPASMEGKTLAAVRFRNERAGIVVTDGGECLKTADGGVGWLYCNEEEVVFRGVSYSGSSNAAGGGDSLTLVGSTSGLGWARTRIPAIVRLKANVEDAAMSTLAMNTFLSPDFSPLSDGSEIFFVADVVVADVVSGEGWGISEGERLFHSTDAGQTWNLLQSNIARAGRVRGLCFVDKFRGWAVGDRGQVVATSDGGRTWATQRREGESEPNLRAVGFMPDGLRGWAVGDAGTILHTEDGGATWVHQARAQRRGPDGQLESASGGGYFRLMPPWYYLSWVVVAFLLLPVRRTAVVDAGEEAEDSVADVLVSDRPLEESDADTIDFKPIALGLSRFLRNENTKPPLTIAITGEWGTGKSSLMNLLRADLRRYDFRPVWFNAWHHQKEEHLLASLLQNVRLQAVPPFWRPEGLIFRARLLRIRGARHWGPVLLLAVFALVALFYWLLSDGAVNTNLAALLGGGGARGVDESAKQYISWAPLLVSVLTVVGAVWRGATAFGVNPASLLASMSRGVRVRDLDAQTSFRQRFAAEFNDVTRALGARSMIVFIDDLDRCRPENVVETLEAVNFLVSSGECFVVIGMARERVEPCVGLSFKDVAAEMRDKEEESREPAAALQPPPEGAGAPKPTEAEMKRLQEREARRKRYEYAEQYLDKLINIEVPVPAPTPKQSCDILVAHTRGAEAPHAEEASEGFRRRRLPAGAAALLRDYGRLLLWCVGAVLLLSGCYALASLLARPAALTDAPPARAAANANTNANVNANANTANANANTGANVSANANANTSANVNANTSANTNTNANANANAAQANLPALTPGKRSVFPAAAPVLLVALAVLWVGFWVLTRRPDLVVKDSPKFVDALKVWHALVFSRSPTPRSVKRFMNRVRYLAMRQRRQADSPPAWRRLLRRFFPPAEPAADAAAAQGEGAHAAVARPIPDELLVALAAIQHFKPGLLSKDEDEVRDALLVATTRRPAAAHDLSTVGLSPDELRVLFDAKERHFAAFNRWNADELRKARAEFLRISEGVHVN